MKKKRGREGERERDPLTSPTTHTKPSKRNNQKKEKRDE